MQNPSVSDLDWTRGPSQFHVRTGQLHKYANIYSMMQYALLYCTSHSDSDHKKQHQKSKTLKQNNIKHQKAATSKTLSAATLKIIIAPAQAVLAPLARGTTSSGRALALKPEGEAQVWIDRVNMGKYSKIKITDMLWHADIRNTEWIWMVLWQNIAHIWSYIKYQRHKTKEEHRRTI